MAHQHCFNVPGDGQVFTHNLFRKVHEEKNMQYNKCLHIRFHLLNLYKLSFLFVGHRMLQI